MPESAVVSGERRLAGGNGGRSRGTRRLHWHTHASMLLPIWSMRMPACRTGMHTAAPPARTLTDLDLGLGEGSAQQHGERCRGQQRPPLHGNTQGRWRVMANEHRCVCKQLLQRRALQAPAAARSRSAMRPGGSMWAQPLAAARLAPPSCRSVQAGRPWSSPWCGWSPPSCSLGWPGSQRAPARLVIDIAGCTRDGWWRQEAVKAAEGRGPPAAACPVRARERFPRVRAAATASLTPNVGRGSRVRRNACCWQPGPPAWRARERRRLQEPAAVALPPPSTHPL